MRGVLRLAFVAVSILSTVGCATVIRRDAEPPAPVATELHTMSQDLEAHSGSYAVLGGEILENHEAGKGSVLLVVHKPLTSDQRPSTQRTGDGLFAVRFEDRLDPGLFHRGQRVTVEGRVGGAQAAPWGGEELPLLWLDGSEIHLWDPAHWSTMTLVRGEKEWLPRWYDPYYGKRPWWW